MPNDTSTSPSSTSSSSSNNRNDPVIVSTNNKFNEIVTTTTNVFDDLDGKFLARLREIASHTRTTAEGNSTITFRTARIEAVYTPDVIKKIEAGRLIAIPNVMGVGGKDIYSVYEVADVYPMHYSMLTLDRSQPGAIRKEFMTMIEKEWQTGSKSTWIEIVAAPTGYIMQIEDKQDKKQAEPNFIRKNAAPLIGSEVRLLNKEAIQKFVCYTPKENENIKDFTIGSLFGLTEQQVPFVVNMEKLLYYHVGAFAFTGSGKSNLTAHIIRKAIRSVKNIKFVIFDISSEYGINILDLLRSVPSRVVLTDELIGKNNTRQVAEDYLRRHVVPDALADKKEMLLVSIEELINQDKIRTLVVASESEDNVHQFSTYGGLLRSLSELTNDKYNTAYTQKLLIPPIIDIIKNFLAEKKLDKESVFTADTLELLKSINERVLSKVKLRADAALSGIFNNLRSMLESTTTAASDKADEGKFKIVESKNHESTYDAEDLVKEILDEREDSPKIFVINLPEADDARYLCADILNMVFGIRKHTFSVIPMVVFVFDEAQEFIPQEKRKDDGTEYSSRAVEKLLRHGRKYHLHGWISTQRVAHLNTNALQQLHSYFVSTMPRPYDRYLISDSFGIDDAFINRTLMFQNGDWLMTSFKATTSTN
jgi:uncharacterized protein